MAFGLKRGPTRHNRAVGIKLPILLDAGAPMADLQAGVDVLGEDTSAGGVPAARPRRTSVEEELDLFGAAKIEMLADHLLEELAAVERAVEDLGACLLKLKN